MLGRWGGKLLARTAEKEKDCAEEKAMDVGLRHRAGFGERRHVAWTVVRISGIEINIVGRSPTNGSNRRDDEKGWE